MICACTNEENVEVKLIFTGYCQSCSDTFLRALVYHKISKVKVNQIPHLKGSLPWQDTKFGWFPNPRNEKCNFSNSILKDYYEQTWHAHADPEYFRKQFIKECNREWDIKIQCDYLANSIQYITGTNSNAIGSRISTEKLKPGDDKTKLV